MLPIFRIQFKTWSKYAAQGSNEAHIPRYPLEVVGARKIDQHHPSERLESEDELRASTGRILNAIRRVLRDELIADMGPTTKPKA